MKRALEVLVWVRAAGLATALLGCGDDQGNAPDAPEGDAATEGDAVAPAMLALDRATASFGPVRLASVSAPLTFTITNTGAEATGAVAASVTGADAARFAITATTCTAPLAPAATCAVSVTFSPLVRGTKAANLVIAGMPGGTVMAALDGEGLAYETLLAMGNSHSCVRRDTGTLKCWGENGQGQLGVGDTASRGDGPNEMGANLPSIALATGRTIVTLAGAANSQCARLDDATVQCWGYGDAGQLGLGDIANRGDAAGELGDNLPVISLGTGRTVAALEAGGVHYCAKLDDGTLKCWGHNQYGQLGLGDVAHRGDAAGEMGDSLPVVALGTGRTVVKLSGGALHTCAILDNATVKCWGYNMYGQCGLGITGTRGDAPGEMGDNLPAIAFGTGRTAVALAGGYFHSCALLDDATVKCWGYNQFGQLGLGDLANRGDQANEMGDNLPVISLGTGRTAVALTAGTYHTCALLDNATVKCWGYNAYGQLGLGDTNSRGDATGEMGDSLPAIDFGVGRTVIAVEGGEHQTCALLDNGAIKCWGYNLEGELGLGDKANRGDAGGEMGDSLPVVEL